MFVSALRPENRVPTVSEKQICRIDRIKYIAAQLQLVPRKAEINTERFDGQLYKLIKRSAIAYAGILHLPVSENCDKQGKWVTRSDV